jgi:DNA-directed RNA polymerase specialized sigma24 family protein
MFPRTCITLHRSMSSLTNSWFRLQRVLARNPTCCPKTAITKTVNDLVHDLNRTAIRQEARFVTRSSFDDLVDQRGNVEVRLVEDAQQAEAIAMLSALKDKDRELVEQVYGLHGCEVDRNQIALELGVLRNTIDQRLRRIFKSIRDALGT